MTPNEKWLARAAERQKAREDRAKARETEDRAPKRKFRTEDSRLANHVDGYDRDNLGESPDY